MVSEMTRRALHIMASLPIVKNVLLEIVSNDRKLQSKVHKFKFIY